MLALDSGDKIRGDASAANVVDYTINGISGSVITQLADGQLPAAEGDLFTAGAAVAVASITLCNTDSARTVNLYLQPSGGTSRRIIAKDTSLGVGNSLHFSGDKVTILSPSGGLVTTHEAHTLGGAAHDADTLANLNTKVSDATLDDSSASRTPNAHKNSHVNSDSIRDATASLKGLATAAQITKLDGIETGATVYPAAGEQAFLDTDLTKLDGIEAGATLYPGAGEQAFLDADHSKLDAIEASADVTDATNVAAADAVMEADFNAQTILRAITNDTPTALTVGEQTVVGRITGGNIVALTVAQLITLALSAALPENVGIILDAALSADQKWSGIVEAGVAGVTVNFGDLLYHDVTAGEWLLAKANVAATSKGKLGINITIAEAGDGDSIMVLLWGKVRSDADYAFTVDAPVFISAATAGDMTSTVPTGTTDFVVRIVGYGNTADELFFCPDNTYLELA